MPYVGTVLGDHDAMDLDLFVANGRPVVRVRLSRRNLVALLTKLRDPESKKTIYRECGDIALYVVVEPDAQHYARREPGAMAPWTEAAIAAFEEFE